MYELRANVVVYVYVNFDEMPMSFSGSMTGGKTMEVRGTRAVFASVDPNWDRRNSSFIPVLCVVKRALGWEAVTRPCLVVLRRDAKRSWVLTPPKGWLVAESASGVVTTTFVVNTILGFVSAAVKSTTTGAPVLIMDSASGHISLAARDAAKRLFHLAVSPGGITQFSQPVDCGYAHLLRTMYGELYYAWVAGRGEGHLKGQDAAQQMLSWLGLAHLATCAKISAGVCA